MVIHDPQKETLFTDTLDAFPDTIAVRPFSVNIYTYRCRRQPMNYIRTSLLAAVFCCTFTAAQAQQRDRCAELNHLKISGVEITKAELIPAGTTLPVPYPGAPVIGSLPAHCRVDGVINRRKGVDGEEFGIGFAVTLPHKEAWNEDFMMQGGG